MSSTYSLQKICRKANQSKIFSLLGFKNFHWSIYLLSTLKPKPEDSKGKTSRWEVVSDVRNNWIVCWSAVRTMMCKDLKWWREAIELTWEILPLKRIFSTHLPKRINLLLENRYFIISLKYPSEALKLSVLTNHWLYCLGGVRVGRRIYRWSIIKLQNNSDMKPNEYF